MIYFVQSVKYFYNSMNGIVCISLGQCGNAIGTKFWEVICPEHGIDPTGRYIGDNPIQLEKIDVFFHKTDNNIYIPRAIFVDLEQGNIDLIRDS